jgi:hypothetical protein
MCPAGSQPAPRTEVSLGVRGHAPTLQRAHAPPTPPRAGLPMTINALDNPGRHKEAEEEQGRVCVPSQHPGGLLRRRSERRSMHSTSLGVRAERRVTVVPATVTLLLFASATSVLRAALVRMQGEPVARPATTRRRSLTPTARQHRRPGGGLDRRVRRQPRRSPIPLSPAPVERVGAPTGSVIACQRPSLPHRRNRKHLGLGATRNPRTAREGATLSLLLRSRAWVRTTGE